jgi:nucleotide-binding universal stress UspA family protein
VAWVIVSISIGVLSASVSELTWRCVVGTSTFRIVVGIDGSEGGRRALAWAVREAAARRGSVQAVTAWRWDGMDLPPYASTHPDQERDRAQRILDDELGTLPEFERGRVSIASQVVEGRAADVLSSAALDADLLVLGSHGHSRVRHTVLGSVSEECVRKAVCPVVVLPAGEPRPHVSAEPALRAAS